ncbi:MAG: LptF/LptG family permease, partial [Alphaproteobacteria bacterium]|nr:LptF/LptG family permease [Alphaproteobacteria bacterium]
REYERIEAKLDNSPLHNNLIISKTDIFVSEKYQDMNRIIKVKSIDLTKKSISDITIITVDSKNELIQRIDASYAELDNNQFKVYNPLVTTLNKSFRLNELSLQTNLSIDSLLQRFTAQEMVSIWDLPELINKLVSSGLPILNYQIYFFKQLFKPLATLAMALLACWFLKFDNRSNSGVKDKAFIVIVGIVTYFTLEISLRILAYSGLTPMFAVLLPVSLIILIGNFVILHFHES